MRKFIICCVCLLLSACELERWEFYQAERICLERGGIDTIYIAVGSAITFVDCSDGSRHAIERPNS